MRSTKASTLPDTASASATAASLPDCTISPRNRLSTVTSEPGSRNIFELPAGTFQARVDTRTFCSGFSVPSCSAPNTI